MGKIPLGPSADGNEHQKGLKPEISMDPYLEETLQSAYTDQVLKGGTGMYDFCIQSLVGHLQNPKNAPFRPHILAAIEQVRATKSIDPIRAEIRKQLRDVSGVIENILGPKGPMELE